MTLLSKATRKYVATEHTTLLETYDLRSMLNKCFLATEAYNMCLLLPYHHIVTLGEECSGV